MARPLRRVVITLAIRLGISHTEVSRWDMEAIREYLVMLSGPKAHETLAQSPEEMERSLRAALGNLKVN